MPSDLLKVGNNILVSIGIGPSINSTQIRLIASEPKDQFAVEVPDFGALGAVVANISDLIKLCPVRTYLNMFFFVSVMFYHKYVSCTFLP